MSYSDLLKDPRWQRKRLEVMQYAGFKCVRCGDKETTLNVHHIRYIHGRKPWDYDYHELECLCEPCHKREHGLDREVKAAIPAASDWKWWRNHVRKQTIAKAPETEPLYQRMDEIDAALPHGTPDEKDALTLEKIDIADRIRACNARIWVG